MCTPIIGIIAAAVSAVASVQQGKAAQSAAGANANAQRQTALSAENSGAQQAANKLLQTKRLMASQVAAAGAGGVDPSTGTPLTIQGQTAQMGELDSLRIINNASRTAWGYNAQAGIEEFQGGKAQTAGYLNAGASLLGGASSAAFSYINATK